MTTTPAHTSLTSSDGTQVAVRTWLPDGPPRGVVQLTHGMGEHVLRYAPLAGDLTAAGWAVVGQDHRGHGATALGPDRLGDLGPAGWEGLVDDVGLLLEHARSEHPGVPVVLLGHSMGSFAVQQLLGRVADRVHAVALTGTAALDLLEPALDLDAPLDLTGFNAPFEQRTGYEWLSRDEEQVDRYVADPLCGFGLVGDGAKQMFVSARPLAAPGALDAVPRGLPLLVAVGDQDPVNAGLALLDPLVERYRQAGLDVEVHVYPGARHEVFNETNRDEVVADLLAWLDRVAPRS